MLFYKADFVVRQRSGTSPESVTPKHIRVLPFCLMKQANLENHPLSQPHIYIDRWHHVVVSADYFGLYHKLLWQPVSCEI
jgi:hypothetical protein